MQAVEVDVEIPFAFGFLFDPPLGQLRYRVAYGGRGSAKSWQFARALLIHGAQQPLRILCAREFQVSLNDSVRHLLVEQAQFLGLDGFYDLHKPSIPGINGTEFLFKGLRRNIAEIKSTEGIDVCWIEEAEAVSEESWRVLPPTIRKEGSEIWVSFNPAYETDPTYKRLVADPQTRSVVKKVGYQDNPWLPGVLKDEAEEMRRRDPEAFANVWGGETWSRSDAEVLSGKWMVDDFTPQSHWLGPYYGVDWGFATDPTIIVRVWLADSRLYIEYDEGGPKLDTDATEKLFDKVPDSRKYVIRADSARPETINEQKKRGFKIVGAEKWEGSVKDGVDHLRSYEKIVIHSRCKRAQQEARAWRYKTDPRTDDVLPVLKPGNDHVWDAVRYALVPMIRHKDAPRSGLI